jgi:aminoglycoside phosphotransferase (APT) family kinase protein
MASERRTVFSVETPLTGGRITAGVVRVGDTVRRPPKPNVSLVRALLGRLEQLGLEFAPRYLGIDAEGRESFGYVEGEVPDELDSTLKDSTLMAAALLIRRFHDATAGSAITQGREVVCHGDLSPCNTVFRAGVPVALIDFDNAAPGTRLDDLGYGLFLWLNLGTDGPDAREQSRRIGVFCNAYGIAPGPEIVEAIRAAVVVNIERLRREHRLGEVEWWQAQLGWIDAHAAILAAMHL